MKKSLLIVAAVFAAVGAKAQGTWFTVTEGMDKDNPTVVCEQGEAKVVAADVIQNAKIVITDGGGTWTNKSSYSADDNFEAVNGKTYPKTYIQGTTNGMGAFNEDGSYKIIPGLVKDGATSAHIEITPSIAGTVYVVAKYGKNKNIWAAKVAEAELEDVDFADMSSYIYAYEGLFIKEDGTYGGAAAAENDTYAALPLQVEPGYTYFFWVSGSKIMLCALDFVAGEASVKNLKADAQNGAAYNLAGQKVNENYKGVIVKNGKKYIK